MVGVLWCVVVLFSRHSIALQHTMLERKGSCT